MSRWVEAQDKLETSMSENKLKRKPSMANERANDGSEPMETNTDNPEAGSTSAPAARTAAHDQGNNVDVYASGATSSNSPSGSSAMTGESSIPNSSRRRDNKRSADTDADLDRPQAYQRADDDDPFRGLISDDDNMGIIAFLVEGRQQIIAQIKELCAKDGRQAVCEEPDPWEHDSDDNSAWDRDSCWDLYLDDISGKVLDSNLVTVARQSELDYIHEMGVWESVPGP